MITPDIHKENPFWEGVFKSSKGPVKCTYCTGFEEKLEKQLANPVSQQIGQMERARLLSNIASYLGSSQNALAEKILDDLKYQITEYVLKHEFNLSNNLSVQLTLWLEHHQRPASYQCLQDIIRTYLKPHSDKKNF